MQLGPCGAHSDDYPGKERGFGLPRRLSRWVQCARPWGGRSRSIGWASGSPHRPPGSTRKSGIIGYKGRDRGFRHLRRRSPWAQSARPQPLRAVPPLCLPFSVLQDLFDDYLHHTGQALLSQLPA